MKTIKKVKVTPMYLKEIPLDLEEGVLYISLDYKVAVHKCLCGCGNKTVTPLKSTEWSLKDIDGKISMSPSIGNYNFPCSSHYIIDKGYANFV